MLSFLDRQKCFKLGWDIADEFTRLNVSTVPRPLQQRRRVAVGKPEQKVENTFIRNWLGQYEQLFIKLGDLSLKCAKLAQCASQTEGQQDEHDDRNCDIAKSCYTVLEEALIFICASTTHLCGQFGVLQEESQPPRALMEREDARTIVQLVLEKVLMLKGRILKFKLRKSTGRDFRYLRSPERQFDKC